MKLELTYEDFLFIISSLESEKTHIESMIEFFNKSDIKDSTNYWGKKFKKIDNLITKLKETEGSEFSG